MLTDPLPQAATRAAALNLREAKLAENRKVIKILELRFSASLSSAFLQRKKALDYLINADKIL